METQDFLSEPEPDPPGPLALKRAPSGELQVTRPPANPVSSTSSIKRAPSGELRMSLPPSGPSREKNILSEKKIISIPRSSSFVSQISSRASSFRSQTSKHASNRSLSSLTTVHHPVLDDAQFAPPPKQPQSLEVTKSQYFSQKRDLQSTLPPFHEIKHSGEVNARFSLKSLLINKKWRPTFWIMFGKNQLLFFRSKTDFDEWASNPFLSKSERDKLVKLNVDVVNDMYKPGPQMRGYKVTPVRTKTTREGVLNAFKLEKWYSYGPSVVAAFGGKNACQVGSLRSIMHEMIQRTDNNFSMEVPEGFSYPESEAESDFNPTDREIQLSHSNISFSTMSFESQQDEARQDSSMYSNEGQPQVHLGQQKHQERGRGRGRTVNSMKLFSTLRSRSNDSIRSQDGSKFRLPIPRTLSRGKLARKLPPRAPSGSHLQNPSRRD